jgi:hypothetical protein
VPVLIGQLRERDVQDGDVVGSSVAAGVAAPKLCGEELTGVVAGRQPGVEPEGLLNVGAASSFSL